MDKIKRQEMSGPKAIGIFTQGCLGRSYVDLLIEPYNAQTIWKILAVKPRYDLTDADR